jgi:cell division protein FtsQ
MSGDYSFGYYGGMNEKIAGNTKSKYGADTSKKIEKGLKRLLIIAGIILGAELIWLFGISPCIPFSTLEIRGFDGFDGAEVLAFANIMESASFVSVKAKDVQQKLSSHHLVESARVIKRFPDRLSIFLEPRRAVALSLAEINGRQMPLYIDRYGVVFKSGSNGAETQNLPVLSGLVFENPSLGMRLPAALVPLLEDFSRIQNGSPELLAALSEIQISRKTYDDYDIVLYPVHSSIRIRLENNLTEDVLRYVLLMLDVLESRFPKPIEIDFRSGMGSYIVKEAPSGE